MTPSKIFLGIVIYFGYLNVFANSLDQWIVELIWPLLRSLNVKKRTWEVLNSEKLWRKWKKEFWINRTFSLVAVFLAYFQLIPLRLIVWCYVLFSFVWNSPQRWLNAKLSSYVFQIVEYDWYVPWKNWRYWINIKEFVLIEL